LHKSTFYFKQSSQDSQTFSDCPIYSVLLPGTKLPSLDCFIQSTDVFSNGAFSALRQLIMREDKNLVCKNLAQKCQRFSMQTLQVDKTH